MTEKNREDRDALHGQGLSREVKRQIADRISAKGAVAPCPRCNHKEFSIADGYAHITVDAAVGNITLGGKVIPCAAVVCSHCGYVNLHALGALGLLPPGVNSE